MENGRIVVEYLGSNRNLDQIPRKSDRIYDERLGRDKVETIHWRITEDNRVISQPIDASFAAKLIKSKSNPGGSPYFTKYNPDNKPELIVIQSKVTGDAALKKEVSELKNELEQKDREILRLNQMHGKVQNPALTERKTTKQIEKQKLTPKKDEKNV